MKVIEITGLPKAGKTTLVNRLAIRLRGQGLSVKKIMDVSGKSPVDPDNVWFDQTWIAHRLLDKLFDKGNQKYDLVLIQRGLLERIISINTFCKFKMLSVRQAKLMTEYLKSFLSLQDLVIYLNITPRLSLARNKGRKGKTLNDKFLNVLRKAYKKFLPKYADRYFIIEADQKIDVVVDEAEDLIKMVLKKK